MSSDPQSEGPSPEAEASTEAEPRGTEGELSLPELIRVRGEALVDGLDQHSPGSKEYAGATGAYVFAAAVGLGFERERAEAVREAARLHDVGNVYVPNENPADAGRDSEADAERPSGPAQRAEDTARLAWGAGLPESVCEWLRRWPTRFDAGEELPIEARLINAGCACDEALRSQKAQPVERMRVAAGAIREMAGTRLDPEVAEALAKSLDRVVGTR